MAREEGRANGDGAGALGEAPFRRALIVVNPISGRGRGMRAAQELEEGLRRSGVGTELVRTEARGAAFTLLRGLSPEVDLVLAVGGDGTLREVLDGLVDPEIPVALLPYGTANVLAHELGLPRDVHHALEIILRGHRQALDVTHVKGHLSFLVTGVGIDAMAVRDVEERRHGTITKWSYVLALCRALLSYVPPRMRVELDGEALDGEFGFVLVSNTAHYGGLLRLERSSRLDDGRLEVYLFPTGSIPELAASVLRGVLRGLPGGAVEMRRARRVRIDSEEPVPYQIDGDFGGETPLEVELAPNQYRLLVP